MSRYAQEEGEEWGRGHVMRGGGRGNEGGVVGGRDGD